MATLFAKDGLSDGDHEVTVTVVGWYGKPRNKASSDSWVEVDKFVVNGLDCDDAGLTHTFTTQADGKATLWLNRSEILSQTEPRSTREELTSQSIKLLRQQTPLQLNYTDATTTGGVLLQWSHPFQFKQPVPTSCLYPSPQAATRSKTCDMSATSSRHRRALREAMQFLHLFLGSL